MAYVEFYNQGEDITADQLTFAGVITGSHTSTATISQGTYAVFYDGEGTNLPNCVDCSCTEQTSPSTGSNYWCDDASYFGCGSSSGESYESISSGCSVYSSGQTVSLWDVTITDDDSSVDIETVTFDDSNSFYIDLGASAGYSFETFDIGYYNGFGTSWTISCNTEGTPGQGPIDSTSCGGCSSSAVCQAGGDTGATCSSSACSCDGENYYNYDDIICLPLPQPSNCTGL